MIVLHIFSNQAYSCGLILLSGIATQQPLNRATIELYRSRGK